MTSSGLTLPVSARRTSAGCSWPFSVARSTGPPSTGSPLRARAMSSSCGSSGSVLARAAPVRAPEMVRELAEVIESKGAHRREDVLRVATWRLAGGDVDPERTLAAAVIARWRYDFPLAERLARRAVQAGAGFDAGLLAAQSAA